MADTNLKRKRVAIFHYELVIGGAEKVIADIFEVLLRENCSPTIFTCYFNKSSSFKSFSENEGRIKCFNLFPFSIFGYFQTLMALIRNFLLAVYFCLFFSKNYDVAIVDTPGHISIPILKLFGIPVIFYCHYPDLLMTNRGSTLRNIYRFFLDFWEIHSMKYADMIFCNSNFSKDSIILSFPSIKSRARNDQNYLKVLYPFADSKKIFKFLENPVGNEIQGGYFLSFNRIESKKSIEIAINAFKCFIELKKSKETSEDFKLVIAGAFDVRKKDNVDCLFMLEQMVDFLSLNNEVIFQLNPSEERKLNLIYNAIGLVYTPRSEHFGIVPLEGMLLRCPVIVMNSGGPLETIIHHVTGFHSNPTPESITTYMNKLTDKVLRTEIGNNGLIHCKKNFNEINFANELIESINILYKNI